MQVDWDIDGIEIEVIISDIKWDNDSTGMTEAWGCLKDDARDDYISDFHVDEIRIICNEPDTTGYELKILDYNFLQDADFVAKVEDMERYE